MNPFVYSNDPYQQQEPPSEFSGYHEKNADTNTTTASAATATAPNNATAMRSGSRSASHQASTSTAAQQPFPFPGTITTQQTSTVQQPSAVQQPYSIDMTMTEVPAPSLPYPNFRQAQGDLEPNVVDTTTNVACPPSVLTANANFSTSNANLHANPTNCTIPSATNEDFSLQQYLHPPSDYYHTYAAAAVACSATPVATPQAHQLRAPSPSPSSSSSSSDSSSAAKNVGGNGGRQRHSVQGRKGDPRMHLAVTVRLARPSIPLLEALIEGGFNFLGLGQPGANDRTVQDDEGIMLYQRKNQLNRRIRLAKNKAAKKQKNNKGKSKKTTSKKKMAASCKNKRKRAKSPPAGSCDEEGNNGLLMTSIGKSTVPRTVSIQRSAHRAFSHKEDDQMLPTEDEKDVDALRSQPPTAVAAPAARRRSSPLAASSNSAISYGDDSFLAMLPDDLGKNLPADPEEADALFAELAADDEHDENGMFCSRSMHADATDEPASGPIDNKARRGAVA